MSFKAKAEFQQLKFSRKAFLLLRSEEVYSFYLSRLGDIISFLVQFKKQDDKINKLIKSIFSILRITLSVSKIVTITLNKSTKLYELKEYTGYRQLGIRDFSFDLKHPFMKELKEGNASLLMLYNLKHSSVLLNNYDLICVIPFILAGQLKGAIFFENVQKDITNLDKYYFIVVSCLIECVLAEEDKDEKIYLETIQKLSSSIDTNIKAISLNEEVSAIEKEQIISLLSKVKEIFDIK